MKNPSAWIYKTDIDDNAIDRAQWHLFTWVNANTLELIEQDPSTRASVLALTLRFDAQTGALDNWDATTLRVTGGFAVAQLEGEVLDATEPADALPTPDEVQAPLMEIMKHS